MKYSALQTAILAGSGGFIGVLISRLLIFNESLQSALSAGIVMGLLVFVVVFVYKKIRTRSSRGNENQ